MDLRAVKGTALVGWGRAPRFDSSITDLQPHLDQKRFKENHQWVIPSELFDQIKVDAAPAVSGHPKIRWLKLEDFAQDS